MNNVNWYLVGFVVIALLWAVPAILAKVRRNRTQVRDENEKNPFFRGYGFALGLITLVGTGALLWWLTGLAHSGLETIFSSGLKIITPDKPETSVRFWRGLTAIPAFLFWAWTIFYITKNSLVICKEFTKAVVRDGLFNHFEVYGAMEGDWGFKPWYARTFFPAVDLRGETFTKGPMNVPCRDGGFKCSFSFLFKPNPKREDILSFVETGDEKLEDVFAGIISGIVRAKLGPLSAREIMANVGQIRQEIDELLGTRAGAASRVAEFEEEYGVDVRTFQIIGLEPDSTTAEAFADTLQASQAGEMVKSLIAAGLSAEEAGRTARMIVGPGGLATEQQKSYYLNESAAKALAAVAPHLANNPVVAGAIAGGIVSEIKDGGAPDTKKKPDKTKKEKDSGHGHGGH
jgi:hypothetical protein